MLHSRIRSHVLGWGTRRGLRSISGHGAERCTSIEAHRIKFRKSNSIFIRSIFCMSLPARKNCKQLQPLNQRWPFGQLVVWHSAAEVWFPMYGSVDIHHMLKSIIWALRSPARTIRIGDLWVDITGAPYCTIVHTFFKDFCCIAVIWSPAACVVWKGDSELQWQSALPDKNDAHRVEQGEFSSLS